MRSHIQLIYFPKILVIGDANQDNSVVLLSCVRSYTTRCYFYSRFHTCWLYPVRRPCYGVFSSNNHKCLWTAFTCIDNVMYGLAPFTAAFITTSQRLPLGTTWPCAVNGVICKRVSMNLFTRLFIWPFELNGVSLGSPLYMLFLLDLYYFFVIEKLDYFPDVFPTGRLLISGYTYLIIINYLILPIFRMWRWRAQLVPLTAESVKFIGVKTA